MKSPAEFLARLQSRKTDDETVVASLLSEFGGVEALLSADYEVYDADNKLVFRIHKKPMQVNQLNTLLKMLDKLSKARDREMKKRKPLSKGRRP